MDHVEAHTTKIIGSVPAREMKSNAARFYAGDVLYGRLRPYLNKIAQPKSDGLASAEFIVFPENELIKSSFLKYRLNARDFVRFANHLNEGDRPRVSFEQIGDFDLLIPPAPEQGRITNKLEELFSELDKGVETLRTAQQQLKVYRQALLKHAFEGKLTAEWRARNPDKLESAEAPLARIQQKREARYQQQLAEWEEAQQAWEAAGRTGSKPAKPKEPKALPPLTAEELAELPELPEGWVYVKAEAISDFITKGTTPGKELLFDGTGEIPFIKVYNLTKTGTLDFTVSPTFVSQDTHNGFLARSKVYPGDVLMNIVGPPLGKVSIVPETYPEWNINQAIAIYRSELIQNKLLAAFLSSEINVRRMMSKSKATAGQFNLTLEICRDTIIPLCGAKEQEQLSRLLDEKLSNLEQLEKTIANSMQQAEALRQSILKKAFSGQLVPQNPDDEPASALLERIRAERAAQPPTARRGRQRRAEA
ncbi:Type-1 restriction enzyme EcoKI specificity protein [Thauera sp. GDN1]|nr:Type-1 restriction enzyme EcoKI specificity protein [Thauera sp. GDN1]